MESNASVSALKRKLEAEIEQYKENAEELLQQHSLVRPINSHFCSWSRSKFIFDPCIH